MGSHQLDQAAMNLRKFAHNIDETKMMKPSFLAIITATEYAYMREDGVLVIPLGLLRDQEVNNKTIPNLALLNT